MERCQLLSVYLAAVNKHITIVTNQSIGKHSIEIWGLIYAIVHDKI